MEPAIVAAITSGTVPSDISAQYLNESRDKGAIAAIVLIAITTLIFIAARCFSRLVLVKRFGIDDGLAVLSFIFLVVFVALAIVLIKLGSGRHYAYIRYVMTLQTVGLTETLDFVAHLIYTTALLLCRVSGLTFYHRICGRSRNFRIAIIVTSGILVAAYIPQMLLILLHCLPVTSLWPYDWQPQSARHTCLAWGLVYSVNSSVSLFCDFLLFGIPIAMLYSLEMSRKRKIQLACILLPGILVIAISVGRLFLVIRGQWQADQSWSYNPMLIVEVSEISGTLIALSIPGIKPLWERIISISHLDSVDSSEDRAKGAVADATSNRHSGAFDGSHRHCTSQASATGGASVEKSRFDHHHYHHSRRSGANNSRGDDDNNNNNSSSISDSSVVNEIMVHVDFKIEEEYIQEKDKGVTVTVRPVT